MSDPLVSVVIPTFNRPAFLREAIESVLSQRGVSLEVIVVNDAGLDVASVIGEFESRVPIKYFQHTENRGLPAARNSGIRNSRGRLLAYLDDDDLYLEGHLGYLIDKLEKSPGTGLVYSDALLELMSTDADGSSVFERRILALDYDRKVMLTDSYICPSSILHRRECIDAVGGFDEEMRWCYEDWDFLLKMDTRYAIERVPGATVKVRLRNNGSNMSSTVSPFRQSAALKLMERYGCGPIQPKTFWEVADSLERMRSI